jgi:hypothetical protein
MKSRETIKIDFTIPSFFTIMPTFNRKNYETKISRIKRIKNKFSRIL